MRSVHSLRTSTGTKRGISPYWSHWRSGREKGLSCKFLNACLEAAHHSKRELYRYCVRCENSEGYIRAFWKEDYTPAFCEPKSFDSAIKRLRDEGQNKLAEMWLDDETQLKKRMRELCEKEADR